MTENYTKWFITACFKMEDGSEVIETKSFWSKIATNESEAIARYNPPEDSLEMLEVYRVTRDDDAEELDVSEVSETETVESETTEDVSDETIIHA